MVKEIFLKVGEIPSNAQNDIGIGIVRFDVKKMEELGIREGEFVEIEGKRKTVVEAIRAYPTDAGLNIIRMDGYTRRNAETTIGDKIVLRKAEVREAKKVTVAPADRGVTVHIPKEYIKRSMIHRAITKGDIVLPKSRKRGPNTPYDAMEAMFSGAFGFGEMRFVIVDTIPKGPVKITDITNVEYISKATEVKEEARVPVISYEDIGGIRPAVRKVREMIELPLKYPELFERLGIGAPKGVLLYGPPGTGKTLLARAVANETGSNFIVINGPEVTSKWYGESEKKIRNIFKQAEENAPSIIFIDEIDAIAPKREEVMGEVERRMVAQLLASMDGMESRGQVVVIAATNRPDSLDPALRRPGRFDREIEIGVPDREGRLEILQIHTRGMPLAKDVDLKKIADMTHGYVGADLEALAKESAMSTLRRVIPEVNIKDEKLPEKVLKKLKVTASDFNDAMLQVEPSAMREVLVEVPKVKWDDVGGLEEVKQKLKEMVEWPIKHIDAYKRLNIKPPKGILLYGLPGTGKTLLAKAVANESEFNFISIKGSDVLSKWVGESEQKIREVFKRAKQVAPSIVFIDEIDAIAPRRGVSSSEVTDRVVTQILTEMDGLEGLKGVVVIGATNRPDSIEPALLRSGRFDRQVHIPVPDKNDRKRMFEIHLKGVPLEKDVKIEDLVEKTEGYVGADIEALCREAGINALRRDINSKSVTKKDFDEALKNVKPSVSKELVKSFAKRVKAVKEIHAKEDELSYFG